MRAKVYIETTIPSYLVARPSRDLLIAAHQQITREWWETRADTRKAAADAVHIASAALYECDYLSHLELPPMRRSSAVLGSLWGDTDLNCRLYAPPRN
jgi:hypothetical protein